MFAFFFFFLNHSSLATLHAFSITVELGFLLEPPAAALGSVLYGMALGPTIEHLALGPCGGVGAGHPQSALLSFFSSSYLAEEGFSKPNLVSKDRKSVV